MKLFDCMIEINHERILGIPIPILQMRRLRGRSVNISVEIN